MNIQMEYSKMRSESSECMWKATGALKNNWRIKKALESYFEERAQEVWETLDESWYAHYVVGHEHFGADGDDSDGTSRTI